ncbi:DUF3794 and LysM peptidoglycan-binding domain-containing protein [Limnochorda pilosa]|uniref:LysM domain-containing protein n=1 Tax=Limnochorda pilosa TaxID=1555112 RepID=A0A0K2SQN5_LIMPI|nr:SPOCS domain-containing protein [Limnochorda pilosa]BAS29416.1 hypothetical protein LIP_3608 [Limnochorda pilosa]
MKLRLREKPLSVRERRGGGTARTVVEGSVNLPAHLPPAHRVVLLEVLPDRYRAHPEPDRILLEGACTVRLTYAAPVEAGSRRGTEPFADAGEVYGEQPAERLFSATWIGGVPFTLLVDAEGTGPDDGVQVDVVAREVEWDLAAGGRQVDIDAVLEARVASYAYTASMQPVAEGPLPPGAILEPLQLRAISLVPEVTVEGHAAGELALGEYHPPAERILRAEAVPRVGAVQVEDGRLHAQVDMGYRVLYAPANPVEGQALLARFQAETPFEMEAASAGLEDGMEAELIPLAFQVDATLRDQGRRVWVESRPRFVARPLRRSTLNLAAGVRAEGEEVVERRVSRPVVELVADLERRQEASAVLELPRGKPLIEQVVDVTARPFLETVQVGTDRVTARLVVACGLLYAARVDDDSRPLHYHPWPNALQVEVEMPAPGAEPEMEAQLWAEVEHPVADLINRETTEIRADLRLHGRLLRLVTPEAVAEAVSLPSDARPPATYTFVRVEEDDTLWGLAQRYGVGEDDVRACNPSLQDAEDPDAALHQLRKVCLPGPRPAPARVGA